MFINLHTHKLSENQNIEVFNIQNDLYCKTHTWLTFGLHPWDIETADNNKVFEQLGQFIANKKIIAIGEIGLDRAIQTALEWQKEIFIRHFYLAEKNNLPVIIHCVRAYADFMHLLIELKPSTAWIFHGFNGNALQALQLTGKGCYLSFGEQLLHQPKIQEALQKIPVHKMFFETDTSDKTIEEIYSKASELLHMDLEELKTTIKANFNAVFQL